MALDYLPAQASSVPCESLFSSGKETATEHRPRLGKLMFEQLQILKYSWKHSIHNFSTLNQALTEASNQPIAFEDKEVKAFMRDEQSSDEEDLDDNTVAVSIELVSDSDSN